MTGKDLVLNLKAKLNKLDSAANRAVRPEMALLFLYDAYIKLIRAKYADNGGQEDTTAFQFTQLTTDELNHITATHVFSELEVDEAMGTTGLPISDIPAYWIHLRNKAKVKLGTKEAWKTPSLKTLDVIGTVEDDPFNSPTFNDPIVFFEDSRIKFLTEGFEVSDVFVSYIKKPEKLTLESEVLAPFTDEIEDAACTLILENWKDGRIQTQLTATKVLKSE